MRFGRLISGQAVRRKIRDAFGSAGIAVGQYDDRVAVLQKVESRTAHAGCSATVANIRADPCHRSTEIKVGKMPVASFQSTVF